MALEQFGRRITATWKNKYECSPNWKDGSFKNLETIQTAINWRQLPGIIYKQIKGHPEGYPKVDLPIVPFDQKEFFKSHQKAIFIWYGHAALLMRLQGYTILIDPMFGSNTSPIGPIKTKRFSARRFLTSTNYPT